MKSMVLTGAFVFALTACSSKESPKPATETPSPVVPAPSQAVPPKSEPVVQAPRPDSPEEAPSKVVPSDLDWASLPDKLDLAPYEADPSKPYSRVDFRTLHKQLLTSCTYQLTLEGLSLGDCPGAVSLLSFMETRAPDGFELAAAKRDLGLELLKQSEVKAHVLGFQLLGHKDANEADTKVLLEATATEKAGLSMVALMQALIEVKAQNEPQAKALLLDLLRHEEPLVRLQGLAFLEELEHRKPFMTATEATLLKEMVRSDSTPLVRMEACRLVALPALSNTTAFYEQILDGKVDSLPEAGPCLNGLISLWWRPRAAADFTPDGAAWEATLRLLPSLAHNTHEQAESAFDDFYVQFYDFDSNADPKADAAAYLERLKAQFPWFLEPILSKLGSDFVHAAKHNENVQHGALLMLKAMKREDLLRQLKSAHASNEALGLRIQPLLD